MPESHWPMQNSEKLADQYPRPRVAVGGSNRILYIGRYGDQLGTGNELLPASADRARMVAPKLKRDEVLINEDARPALHHGNSSLALLP